MAEYDYYQRAQVTYDRFKWLAALSGGSVVFLTGFIDNLFNYYESRALFTLALVGLAFTLFISIGVQIVASAADRWAAQQTVSPLLLVWEWRLSVLAHVSFLVSIILLVTYLINNLNA